MPLTYDECFATGVATITAAALIHPLAEAFPTKFSRIRTLAIKLASRGGPHGVSTGNYESDIPETISR
jgi:hypothetical protein